MDNSAITKARPRRDDEFYTEYKDIAAEMRHYSLEVFRGKTILCPCDSPASAFARYFKGRFEDLGLSSLLAVSYTPGGKGLAYSFDGVQERQWELAGDGGFLSPEV